MADYAQLYSQYGPEIMGKLPPWMQSRPDLAQAFLDEYINTQGGTGNPQGVSNAMETIRTAPEYRAIYDAAFPGNRREDGSLRLEEYTYLSRMESFRSTVFGAEIDPEVFGMEYVDLIEGDVTEQEFQRRVDALHTRVTGNAPEIRDWYASNYGIDMTSQGILASLMSNRVGDAVLNRQITMAEIGGEAVMKDFDLTTEFVEMLANEGGMDRDEAAQMFGTGRLLLPTLGAMAARHGDPDDSFDITEFARASALDDPTQLGRINRLRAQEASTFTGGKQLDIASSRTTGGLTGLTDV